MKTLRKALLLLPGLGAVHSPWAQVTPPPSSTSDAATTTATTTATTATTATSPAAESPGLALQLGSTAVALAFVLLLAWVLLRLLKRVQAGRQGDGSGERPVVLHSVNLGPRERLVSVRHRGRDYLLGVTPAAIHLIDRHDPLIGDVDPVVDPSSGRP